MITELINSNSYNVFVPSIQEEINFKPLTVLQYKSLLAGCYNNPLFNNGFKKELFDIFENNNQKNVIPTEYDIYIYALYIRYYDIASTYKGHNIQLIQPKNITFNNLEFKCCIPSKEIFIEYTNYLEHINPTPDNFLLAEFAKHLESNDLSFESKIDLLKQYQPQDLISLLQNIDTYKSTIKDNYYLSDNVSIPFGSSLLLE